MAGTLRFAHPTALPFQPPYLKSVILRSAKRVSKDDGPAVADSSFEARCARTSSDNGKAVARG
jgi:hypothetical protein